jgi:hypothetical protein
MTTEAAQDSGTKESQKTGPKPKKLKTGTYQGIEVGRGDRKRIVDPREVEKLAALGMKNSEISEWLDIDDSTLSYNFKRELAKGQHNLRTSLRQAQIRLALSGNATMLIWLGKNMLGQSDNPTNSGDLGPLPWSDAE